MTYVSPNFPTKKAFLDHVKAARSVRFWEPGLGEVPTHGQIYVEGPHAPKPHTWYAEVTLHDGQIMKVR